MDCTISADFGADSSSRFLLQHGLTDTHTKLTDLTDCPTHATAIAAGRRRGRVGKYRSVTSDMLLSRLAPKRSTRPIAVSLAGQW